MKKSTILIVEDERAVLFRYLDGLSEQDYELRTAPDIESARKKLDSFQYDAILLDLNLPDGDALEFLTPLRSSHPYLGIIVIAGNSALPQGISSMQSGADNYLTKPVDLKELQISLEKCLEIVALRKRDAAHKRIDAAEEVYFGESEPIQALLEYAMVALESTSTILLQGETGTGKGVLAKWIHYHSSRSGQPFIELNCSMLNGDLLRSELYGHARGAFTSAMKDRQGLIEAADGGTLFLDEIGDIDLEVQVQLLKTIEEKTFRRIGENKVRSSDFRLICATHQDLQDLTRQGRFRQDLYYRICVFPILIPPLRGRKEDIIGLAEHILTTLGYEHFPLDSSIGTVLNEYDWPGNIRELRNMLERALLLSRKGPLAPAHFPGLKPDTLRHSVPLIEMSTGQYRTLAAVEHDYILQVLKSNSWDKNKAAEILGISRASIYRKIKKRGT